MGAKLDYGLTGGVGAGIGAGIGVATAATAAASGAALTGGLLAASLTPAAIVALPALGAAYLWKKTQAHGKADKFVQGYQNKFGADIAGIIDPFNAAASSKTLTYDNAKLAMDALEKRIQRFQDDAMTFSVQGGDHKTVVDQAFSTLNPLIGSWRSTIQKQLDALAPADTSVKTPPPEEVPTLSDSAAAASARQAALNYKRRFATPATSTNRKRMLEVGMANRSYKSLLGY